MVHYLEQAEAALKAARHRRTSAARIAADEALSHRARQRAERHAAAGRRAQLEAYRLRDALDDFGIA